MHLWYFLSWAASVSDELPQSPNELLQRKSQNGDQMLSKWSGDKDVALLSTSVTLWWFPDLFIFHMLGQDRQVTDSVGIVSTYMKNLNEKCRGPGNSERNAAHMVMKAPFFNVWHPWNWLFLCMNKGNLSFFLNNELQVPRIKKQLTIVPRKFSVLTVHVLVAFFY